MVLENELYMSGFLAAVWVGERFFSLIGVSPIIVDIIIGMAMGPPLADIVPYTDALELAGKFGVMLLVIESGLGFNLQELKAVGPRAFFMAGTGVIFPVALVCFVYPFALPGKFAGVDVKLLLSIGAALAPTSLGFSTKLLKEAGILRTSNGMLVCTAAVVDDVLSLILLGEVLALSDPTAINLIMPVVGALASAVAGITIAFILAKTFPYWVPEKLQGEVGLFLTFVFSLAVGWVGAFLKSSDLLGCFMVGAAFAPYNAVRDAWRDQVKRICTWLTRLFFACTIGFAVPSLTDGPYFSSETLIRAGILLGCAVVGKMTVGFYAKPLSWTNFNILGWAMGGRGEFSFLIATDARSEGLIGETDFCACVWALIVASLMAPFLTKVFLSFSLKPELEAEGLQGQDDAMPGEVYAVREPLKRDLEGSLEMNPPGEVKRDVFGREGSFGPGYDNKNIGEQEMAHLSGEHDRVIV